MINQSEMDALLEKDRLDDKRKEDLEYANDMKDENESDAWDLNESDYC